MMKNQMRIIAVFFWMIIFPVISYAKDYSLNLKTIYDFRSVRFEDYRTNDEDHDFFQYATFRSDGYGFDNLETFFSARVGWDIGDTMRRDYYRDVRDTYSGSDKLSEIYSAWADFKNIMNIADIKAGRQYFYGAEMAHFDGATISLNNIPYIADLEMFGGRRVSLRYSPRRKGIWGGNIGFKPADGTKVMVRMVKYHDYSYDVSIYQEITGNLDFDINYAITNDDPEDIDASLNYLLKGFSTRILLNYYRRLGGSGSDDFDFDYTSSTNKGSKGFEVSRLELLRLQPYEEYYILLHQPFLQNFGVRASYKIKNLINNNEGNQYNSDYNEYTVGFDCKNIPIKGSDILLEWRHFKDSRRTKRFETESQEMGGEFSQMLNDKFSVSARGFYRAYDYNRKKYQTYGMTTYLKGYVTDKIDFLLSYSYEEDDDLAVPFSKIDYLQGVRVEVGFNF